jgi:quinoprotein glucose dehydrogenase
MRKIIPGVLLLLCACQSSSHRSYAGWTKYKGSDECIHYSSLTEVDTGNVSQLKIAWEYHSGDVDTAHHSQIQCNPIIVDGLLYGTSPGMKLFAIDARTGQRKWEFSPFDSLGSDKKMFFILNNCRGVTYWSDGADDKRIYYTAGSNLYAVNALDGHPVQGFGHQGKIDLHEGLGRDVSNLFITATSPPTVYRDLLIMGSRVDEGPAAAPGHIRAYDVRTGRQVWIFHTIPQPGEAGYETWEDTTAYRFIGGANAWSGFSLDEARGLLFAATGSASYDFYGGRRKGNNLFGNSVLAIEAATGKLAWHYQVIHHDVWDRDCSSPPALITIDRGGKKTDALALTTKMGFVYIFDRATGKPVYDVVEKPVPAVSELEGEKLSPMQPYPTAPAPFMRQQMTEKDINPYLSDSSFAEVKKRLLSYKRDHLFNPPSMEGTVEFPGLDGGAEWGGPAFDPATGLLYINANEMAWIMQAKRVETTPAGHENNLQAGLRLYQANCMSCHGQQRKGGGAVPSLENIQQKYSPAAFDTLVQSGRRMMPAFKQLAGAERRALASFVLNIGKEQKNAFVDSAARKDDPTQLPYAMMGYNKFLSKEGYPAISPPWGTLNAIDLNTGTYVWKTALGSDPAFPQAKEPTGVENYGAAVVTAGGLLFIAAAKDGKLRAFNKRTGKLLWEYTLPVPAYATPAVYELEGRQYLVIACGGGKLNTPSGDSYVAFALENK